MSGTYGLFFDGRRGHARIGAILKKNDRFVERTIDSVAGSPIPAQGNGTWVRDAYPSPAELGLPCKEVNIPTEWGNAPAWVVAPTTTNSEVWVIHLHGIRTTRSVVLPGVKVASRLGMTSLVPSWRGDSEGPSVPGGASTLGQEEWLDVDDAVGFAVSSGARDVVLVGWSMGGLIANLVLHNSRRDYRVIGVALVAPVTSWRNVLKNAIKSAHLPSFVIAPIVEGILSNRVLCRLAGLRKPVELKHLEAGHHREIPTLVLHNPGDETVPFSLTSEFVRGLENAELVTFAKTHHATEWNQEPDRFEKVLYAWLSSLPVQE